MAEQVRFLPGGLAIIGVPAAALRALLTRDVVLADREGIPEAAGCEPWVSSSRQHQQTAAHR